MLNHGSKITVWMLIVVFCAFALAGCGNNMETTEGPAESQQTNETTETTETGNTENELTETTEPEVSLTITTPAENDVAEGGSLEVVGKADGAPNPGKDEVHMELVTKNGEKLGETTSLVADLDNEFSGEVKYEISDNMEKNDDGTIDAELRVYIELDNDGRMEEESVLIKVKE